MARYDALYGVTAIAFLIMTPFVWLKLGRRLRDLHAAELVAAAFIRRVRRTRPILLGVVSCLHLAGDDSLARESQPASSSCSHCSTRWGLRCLPASTPSSEAHLHRARPAQHSRRKHEYPSQQTEDAIHSDADDAKRKQQNPDKRIEEKCQQRQRPAEHEQDAPEQEFHHTPQYEARP